MACICMNCNKFVFLLSIIGHEKQKTWPMMYKGKKQNTIHIHMHAVQNCLCLMLLDEGWTCNQLTSKVDGGITGSRLRWSILA